MQEAKKDICLTYAAGWFKDVKHILIFVILRRVLKMDNAKENLNRSFNMMENSVGKMWDMWLMSIGSLTWTQEQIENITRKQLDQNKTAREEMMRLVEDLSKQARINQEQFQKIVEETVMNTYQHINLANNTLIQDLSKKVDELAKKVENA
ncbi:MAG TPA: hypothetical protein DER60_07165 [Syntrophomonas sp.]|jgi:polyhydroxyalkanoate synthesis regulator phasin|nr:hypothetical protein [Syntrophomonas sp.]